MRKTAIFSIGAVLAGTTLLGAGRDPGRLTILGEAYPRVFFFRAAERAMNRRLYPTYESWEKEFDRLEGIMGKCLGEECRGREPRNAEFFSRFKKRHPEQVVLLHFNGNARDPRYKTEKYFPGHWIYRRATRIVEDVPAVSGETVIHVEDARDFHVNMGRYRTASDDIGLFGLSPDGKHDWNHCEQVRLLAVDYTANTIRVKRGCYGTVPLRFEAGRSRAAAHMVEGPWGKYSHLLWFYNFATTCPRDAAGRTCADVLVEELAGWFGPGGPLEAFDGMEFDVFFHESRGDMDGDGEIDNGMVDGRNTYGIGVFEFARKLRERMGEDFIIQGDGALGRDGRRSQRCWGILNGIESEGWPNLSDWECEDWSGGLNRQAFWAANAHPPAFSYINHKWVRAVPGKPGVHRGADVPFSRDRLVFAAAQFTDSMLCYSRAPSTGKSRPGKMLPVWDEFWQGTAHRLGWLGRPEGPALHLAARVPNRLGARARGAALRAAICGSVRPELTPKGVRITPRDPAAKRIRFSIREVPVSGPDLYVEVRMAAEPMRGYPAAMARFARVGVMGGMIDLVTEEPLRVGMKLRKAEGETALDRRTGAVCALREHTIEGLALPARFVHPPWKNNETGYTFWEREIALFPGRPELRFSLGMGEKSPVRSDGVWFSVFLAEVGADGMPGPYRRIFADHTNQCEWLARTVSLSAWAGRSVRLKFVADAGPRDDSTTDHAYWGDVRIVDAATPDARRTPLVRRMTWVNARSFCSGFYFWQIQSPSVDLVFDIESSEPVLLESVAVYAHPDAMARVFENGIVLANPSRRPYTFDLAALTPGRRYRRLQGSAGQDEKTNNGEAVQGNTVTLGERDGLFLVRVPGE